MKKIGHEIIFMTYLFYIGGYSSISDYSFHSHFIISQYTYTLYRSAITHSITVQSQHRRVLVN